VSVVEVEARYPVSREVVWEELARIERHVLWMSDAVAIDFTTQRREGNGTTFRCTTKVGPFVTQDLMTVTTWVEGMTMGVKHVGLVQGRGWFSLQGDHNATTLKWREELTFPWWALGPLGAFVATPVLARLWATNLARLGQLLAENDDHRTPKGHAAN
jgi:hypothetical protein